MSKRKTQKGLSLKLLEKYKLSEEPCIYERSKFIKEDLATVNDMMELRVVQQLPATGETHIIYIVPVSVFTNDTYDEYIYVDDHFEKIGVWRDLESDWMELPEPYKEDE